MGILAGYQRFRRFPLCLLLQDVGSRISLVVDGRTHRMTIVEGQSVAFGQSVGIKTEDLSLNRSKLNGLPDGVIHDVRELARDHLYPISPVG